MMFRSRRPSTSRTHQEAVDAPVELVKPAAQGAPGPRRGLRDITNKVSQRPATGVAVKAGEVEIAKPVADTAAVAKPSVLSSLIGLRRTSSARSDAGSERARAVAVRPVDDIDARDAKNALAVTDYVQDMFSHFREREICTSIDPNYMRKQPHINAQMRGILVDWLVEVHLKFKLYPETLHLTVSLIDRYLEVKPVARNRLQLVGTTCLLLASKYEEIYPPELRDLVYMTDRAYTKGEILEMETEVLRALHYKLTLPSMQYFLQRYLKAGHADRRMVHLASFICEHCLLSCDMLKYLPSTVAASAVYLARKNLDRSCWSPTLVRYTKYTEEDLQGCLQDISAILAAPSTLRAIQKKYASSKLSNITSMRIEGVEAING